MSQSCDHDKRFSGVFLLPPEDHGCIACALERVAADNKDLRERVQYLVDNWPVPVEDGGITFPDGEFWEQQPESPSLARKRSDPT